MLPQFLYLFLMDPVLIRPDRDFFLYQQREPGFAIPSLQAYIAAFQTGQRGLNHHLVVQTNQLAMSHLSHVHSGHYKSVSNTYEIYFDRFTNYSATRAGVIEFLQFWRSGFNLHIIQFKHKTDPTKAFYIDYVDGKVVCLDAKGVPAPTESLDSLISNDQYQCIVISGLCDPAQIQSHMTEKMQMIFDHYDREITAAGSDHDKIVIIAKHMQRIAQLHPFEDGNIRTCYILINKLLNEHGMPLSILLNPNRLDACPLEAIVTIIKEGQRIYTELLQNTDPAMFSYVTNEFISQLKQINCPAYDMEIPELWNEFLRTVIHRNSPKVQGQYRSGLFFVKPCPEQALIDEFERRCDLSLPGHSKILSFVKTNDYATALRSACTIGACALIDFFIDHHTALSLDLNAKTQANGKTALDWLDAQKINQNTSEISALREKLCQAGAVNQSVLLTYQT